MCIYTYNMHIPTTGRWEEAFKGQCRFMFIPTAPKQLPGTSVQPPPRSIVHTFLGKSPTSPTKEPYISRKRALHICIYRKRDLYIVQKNPTFPDNDPTLTICATTQHGARVQHG